MIGNESHNVALMDNTQYGEEARGSLLALRLITLMIMVSLLTLHLRSLKVFRWELSVSGGLLVTYCIAALGLALCAGAARCGGSALQTYLCGVGSALMAINAAVLWQRWRYAGELTRVVAEFLVALGVPLRRQILTKVILSSAVSFTLLLDLAIVPFLIKFRNMNQTKHG
ncbi:uncharacterized protein LOC123705311 [Colias croceus]|uniref:uncharacterized protein LOC123705311 n=1 Tax=Colias crocea TaxID=72248 RepID=UPI001E2806F0|nr:uncharacterized protein LOC123705311 [Colias croceus]